MIDAMGADDPYTIITESTFVARFLLHPYTDTVDSVANVDAFVDPDGSAWSGPISVLIDDPEPESVDGFIEIERGTTRRESVTADHRS
ncbi:hypothetical protein [Actinoplanes sp. CA-252034]|uniref:hypothetical protein n=1 Tax=Actinoplanes sp. CA-252034 TaxID=3239906 RepID=UPI003D959254